jgi:hypothetical protein
MEDKSQNRPLAMTSMGLGRAQDLAKKPKGCHCERLQARSNLSLDAIFCLAVFGQALDILTFVLRY